MMLCGRYPTGLIEPGNNCKTSDLEPFYVNAFQLQQLAPARSPQCSSPRSSIQFIVETAGQMAGLGGTKPAAAALRDIADDPHLLADLGLTREEVLDQANQPFWR